MNTSTKYNQLMDKIENDLTLLKEKLKKHQKDFNRNNTNWGFIGDLEYVSNEIDEVVKFFNNK
jgi:hypothetical protein